MQGRGCFLYKKVDLYCYFNIHNLSRKFPLIIIKLLGAKPRGIVGTRFARTIVGQRQTVLTFVAYRTDEMKTAVFHFFASSAKHGKFSTLKRAEFPVKVSQSFDLIASHNKLLCCVNFLNSRHNVLGTDIWRFN